MAGDRYVVLLSVASLNQIHHSIGSLFHIGFSDNLQQASNVSVLCFSVYLVRLKQRAVVGLEMSYGDNRDDTHMFQMIKAHDVAQHTRRKQVNASLPRPRRAISLFVCLFLCQQHYQKTAGPICIEFSGKVWSDHMTT